MYELITRFGSLGLSLSSSKHWANFNFTEVFNSLANQPINPNWLISPANPILNFAALTSFPLTSQGETLWTVHVAFVSRGQWEFSAACHGRRVSCMLYGHRIRWKGCGPSIPWMRHNGSGTASWWRASAIHGGLGAQVGAAAWWSTLAGCL
jgi:hypothetical protein